MSHSKLSLDQIFESQIQTLALTRRIATAAQHRVAVRRFLGFLQGAFPQVRRLSELRHDPHLLGWFRWLCQQDPPLRNKTRRLYLLRLRRLLEDLAAEGHSLQPNLIRREDLPPIDQYLPRPLPFEEDQRLQQELRRTDNLFSNALLLTRFTGIRIGECIDLSLDCCQQLAPDHCALHVPLGKLHTERWVPADSEIQRIVARILELRPGAPPARLAKSEGLLLPRGSRSRLYRSFLGLLADAAVQVGCSSHVTPHRLRHTYATEMIRLGVSLPVLMQLLGHKDIGMTLRYVQVTQQDLQREFHLARKNVAELHRVPTLPIPNNALPADLPGIHQALAATRHLLEMFRRGLPNELTRRRLQRLDGRLFAIGEQLDHILMPEK